MLAIDGHDRARGGFGGDFCPPDLVAVGAFDLVPDSIASTMVNAKGAAAVGLGLPAHRRVIGSTPAMRRSPVSYFAAVCAAFTGLLLLAWWLLWTVLVWLPGMFIGG